MATADEIASLQAELEQYKEQLADVRLKLRENPDSPEFLELQDNLEQFVELQTQAINDLKLLERQSAASASAAASPPPPPAPQADSAPPSPPPQAPAAAKVTSEATPSYKVNDEVLAKWLAGDRRFYPARVSAISGKSTDPVYTVIFAIDNSTGTVRRNDIRPLDPAEAPPKPTSSHTPGADTTRPTVAALGAENSAPTGFKSMSANKKSDKENIDASGAAATAGPNPSADPSQKAARSIRNKRELEAGKNKWEQFKKAKLGKKQSIFRTGEGPNARVGFTGSGQAMRKDASRTRHTYEYADDDY